MKYSICKANFEFLYKLNFDSKKSFSNFSSSNLYLIQLARKYPIKYYNNHLYSSTNQKDLKSSDSPQINILDIGCGFGGFLYDISPYLNENSLALGMELRDKVSEYVADKIRSLRINSNHTKVIKK